jgi:hypothetical protein
MTSCTVTDCKEAARKLIAIPKEPNAFERFEGIAMLCKYHYERFEEMYLPKHNDYYGDTRDLV